MCDYAYKKVDVWVGDSLSLDLSQGENHTGNLKNHRSSRIAPRGKAAETGAVYLPERLNDPEEKMGARSMDDADHTTPAADG